MRRPMLPLLLTACAPSGESSPAPAKTPEQALMNQIEAAVRLPDGARPLAAYGRYYSYAAPGRVRAVYLVPSPRFDPGAPCEAMTEDLKSRPCTPGEIAEIGASAAKADTGQVPAGQRRWVKREQDLPQDFDGGCLVLTVDYEVASKHFLAVECGGLA